MSENREMAIPAGGCFWVVQQLRSGNPGVKPSRVASTDWAATSV